MDQREMPAALRAEALRWKCRAFSFAAMPFITLIGVHVLSRGAALPVWIVAVSAMAMGALGTMSTIASFDHRKLTGKLVWF